MVAEMREAKCKAQQDRKAQKGKARETKTEAEAMEEDEENDEGQAKEPKIEPKDYGGDDWLVHRGVCTILRFLNMVPKF